jgi:N-acetylneuraminate synthase/N,N'-diacetyllegionaminate synthase
MLKKLELSHENHLELMSLCAERNIQFFYSLWCGGNYLNDLGLSFFKFKWRNNNYPYLKQLLCGKPVIMSTGMCCEMKLKSIGRSNEIWFKRYFHYYIVILNIQLRWCKSKGNVVNSENFGVQVGYSIILLVEVPIAAGL